MIIFGEKFNSSIPSTYEMMKDWDEEKLIALAKAQEEAGADYLDLNTAMFGEEEKALLCRLTDLVQQHTKCGIMLDSPSPDAVCAALEHVQDRPVIINSITLCERIQELLPVVCKSGAGVVCLPIDEDGMPEDAACRLQNIDKFAAVLQENGIALSRVYMDVIIETLSVKNDAARIACDTIAAARQKYPEMHFTCGLSNISFGLPKRLNINAAFLTCAVFAGLDSAIMDITSPAMKKALLSAEAVAGQDEFCMNYMDYMMAQ